MLQSDEASLRSTKESLKILPHVKRFVCKFCQTDVNPKTDSCERCLKNFQEHGQPKKCSFCKLNSAFIGSKCQRCSSSQKKYGAPITCSKCGVQSAFDNEKAKLNGKLLCWLCFVTIQRKIRYGKRKLELKENRNQKFYIDCLSEPQSRGNRRKASFLRAQHTWLSRESNSGYVNCQCKNNIATPWCRSNNSTFHLMSRYSPSGLSGSDQESNKTGKNSQSRKLSPDIPRKAHSNSQKRHLVPSLDSRLASIKNNFRAPPGPSSQAEGAHKVDRGVEERAMKSETRTVKSSNTDAVGVGGNRRVGEGRSWNGSSLATGLTGVGDGNIVLITRLREEVESLKRQLAKKEQLLLEKDKQLCLVKVNHLNEVKQIRTKYQSKEDEYIKALETYRNRNQELLKKIAHISKGKA